ncbi:hypothetical protein FGB62_350g02 [Gracilaria domingensis]|nr:hypothetical protein FGB62_350g02 [Gracilaria domingensis]
MAFAARWTVAISGMLVVIMSHSDCGEDGPSYFAGLRYLWHPEQWIDEQHIGTKFCYHRYENSDRALDEYIASALLDSTLPVPNDPRQVHTLLERAPQHVGNAIVGTDRDFCKEEEKIASRLQKVVLIAGHLVVLPLLFAIVVILARNYDNLDQVHYEALAPLADGAIILAFVEFSIGIKNLLWGLNGTAKMERAGVSNEERLCTIRGLSATSRDAESNSCDFGIKVD